MRLISLTFLTQVAFAASPDAHALLARAISAFERNQQQEVHWNWTVTETRAIVAKGGLEQKLPDVTVESVIRNDGRRCNAVLSWGDGIQPYLIDSDPDSRCQATEAFHPAFSVPELLKSADVRLLSRPPKAIVIEIFPDKTRENSPDPTVSCAASIRGKVELDPATSFPRQIEGEATGSGCRPSARVPIHYGEGDSVTARNSFQRGASFQMTFELQPDKFQSPERSFWIRVFDRFEAPLPRGISGAMIYWGRRVPLTMAGFQRIVKESHTVAREFGTETTIR